MSYDLTLLEKLPGESWDQAYQRADDGGDDELSPARREQWEQVAARLEASGYERFEGRGVIELTEPELGIQISLFEGSAGAAVPYWYKGEEATGVFTKLAAALQIVQEASSFAIHDPQTDQEVTSFDDFVAQATGSMTETRGFMERNIPAIGGASELRKRPWWRFWDR